MAKRKNTEKKRSTKHYIENWRSSNTNHTKNRGWTQVPRKGSQMVIDFSLLSFRNFKFQTYI